MDVSSQNSMTARRAAHWRPALALGVATGVNAAVDATRTMADQHASFGQIGPLLASVVLMNAVVGTVGAWVGLWLGAALGLDAPLVRAWARGRAFGGKARFHWAALIGVAAGGIVAGVHQTYLGIGLALPLRTLALCSKGSLASFDLGIGEEVKLHLFLMTAIAWCVAKATRSKAAWVFVTAAVLAAVVFDSQRYPMHALSNIRPDLLVRILVLDGIVGPVFGVVYWRWGIEHAMVARFCCNLVLRVLRGC
jgi:hypothetical protein